MVVEALLQEKIMVRIEELYREKVSLVHPYELYYYQMEGGNIQACSMAV